MLRIRHSGKDYLLDRVEHTEPSGQVRLIKRMQPDGHVATASELHLATLPRGGVGLSGVAQSSEDV